MKYIFRNVATVVCCLPLAVACTATNAESAVTVVPRMEPSGLIRNYSANRPPLAASRLVELPFGVVLPRGWLHKQLELQGDGFHGHLTEISGFLKKKTTPGSTRTARAKMAGKKCPIG